MRTYAQLGLVFRFLFVVLRGLKASFQVYRYVFLSEFDFPTTLDKAVCLLIQTFARSIKHAIVVSETTCNNNWKMESLDSFISEDCDISES